MNKRKTVKILWITGAGIIVLYVLALIFINLYAGKQKAQLLTTVNAVLHENLQGNVQVKGIKINAWPGFPFIKISLTGISVTDTLYNRPILTAASISTSISLFNLIAKEKKITNLEVKDGVFHLFTDSSGYSNNYLLKLKKRASKTNSAASGSKVAIKKIEIENVRILVENETKNKRFEFVLNEAEATFSKKDSLLQISLAEECTMLTGLGFNLQRGAYLQNQTLEADWKIQLNTASKVISFGETALTISNHDYLVSGYFDFSDKQQFKLELSTKDVMYKDVQAIVTKAIRKRMSLFNLEHPLHVNGIIQGSLSPKTIPYVNISWQTINNVLQTPAASFTNCATSGNYTNEVIKDSARTDANSRITFSKFSGNWDGIQLSGDSIVVNNLKNASLQFNLHSNCSFEALDGKFALNTIKFLKGNAAVDLQYNGPLNTNISIIENVYGTIHIKNGEVEYLPRNLVFTNCKGDIYFLEDSISLKNIECTYKNTRFAVNVDGRNIRKKLLGADTLQTALICNVFSESVNLGDFKSLFTVSPEQKIKRKADKAKFSRTAAAIDNILEKGALQVNLKANAIGYNNLSAASLDAGIIFKQHLWEITHLSVNLAGGTLNTKGSIKQTTPGYYESALMIKMNDMDVQKAFYAFDNFGQNGIASDNIRGILNTNASIKLGINEAGNIIPSSINGSVDFSLKNGALVNFEPLQKLQNFILKNKDVSNVKFAELKDRFDINGDTIYVNRMEIQSTLLSMFIEGKYSFKGNTDLWIQLPMSNLTKKSNTYQPENIGVNKKVGPSIRLRAVTGDDGKLKFKLTFKKANGKQGDFN